MRGVQASHPLVLAAIRRAPVRFYGPNDWADGHIIGAHLESRKATVVSAGRHYTVPFQNMYVTEEAA